MFDYEWATVQHNINCRLARRRRGAGGDPAGALYALRRPRQDASPTRASRRSTTCPTSSPTRPCWVSSGSTRDRPLVVVRTPPAVSLYHRFENPLFSAVLERVAADEVQAVVLPRTRRAAHRAGCRGRLRGPRGRGRRAVAGRVRRPRHLGGRHDEPRGRRARHARLHDVRGPARRGRRAAAARGPAAAPGARGGPGRSRVRDAAGAARARAQRIRGSTRSCCVAARESRRRELP